jgi:hypothetical protein
MERYLQLRTGNCTYLFLHRFIQMTFSGALGLMEICECEWAGRVSDFEKQ